MSLAVEIINLARTAYLRLLPYLRPAAESSLLVMVAAAAFGPFGVFAGAAAGVGLNIPTIRRWMSLAISVFTGVLHFVQNEPDLLGLVRNLLDMIHRFINGEHEENLILGNQILET